MNEDRIKRIRESAEGVFDQTVAWTFDDLAKHEITADEAKDELETAMAAFDLVQEKINIMQKRSTN